MLSKVDSGDVTLLCADDNAFIVGCSSKATEAEDWLLMQCILFLSALFLET